MDFSIGIEARNEITEVSLRAPFSHEKSRVLHANDAKAQILDRFARERNVCIACPCRKLPGVSLPEIGICGGLEMKTGDNEMSLESPTVKTSCLDKFMVPDVTDGSKTSKTDFRVNIEEMEHQEDAICCKCQLLAKAVVSANREQWSADQVEEADVIPCIPFLCRENIEASSPSDQSDEADILSGYETPEEGTFDPFAPGPEELAFAPKKRMVKEFRPPLRRRLKFDDSDFDLIDDVQGSKSDDSVEDDRILRALYISFLDVALSNQVGSFSEVCLPTETQSSPEPKTPTALPLLTGIAESCPGAPLRHVSKSRKISLDVCRKLDFSTTSP